MVFNRTSFMSRTLEPLYPWARPLLPMGSNWGIRDNDNVLSRGEYYGYASRPSKPKPAEKIADLLTLIRPSAPLRRVGIADFHMVLPPYGGFYADFDSASEDHLHDFMAGDLGLDIRRRPHLHDSVAQSRSVEYSGDRLWAHRQGRVLISALNRGPEEDRGLPVPLNAVEQIFQTTSFEIVFRTNDAFIADPCYIELFRRHRDKVTVGLTFPTLDEEVLCHLDLQGSHPRDRLRAYDKLHNAGIRTCAFLCPLLPGCQIDSRRMLQLAQHPLLETVWAAPIHGRYWQLVQRLFELGSPEYSWFTAVFDQNLESNWSRFAAELYSRISQLLQARGCLDKLRYLVDESRVLESDVELFDQLDGIVLLGPTDPEGYSCNPEVQRVQRNLAKSEDDALFPKGHPWRRESPR